MTIRNLQEANQALLPYVPLVVQLTGKHTTLERIEPLMKLVGSPQDRLRVIHIAGTSGKTSTAYFMAALLHAGGKTVGLTVSPHVDSVTERVQLNGKPLAETEFCQLLGEFLELITPAKQSPSYFELLYAFSLWVFDRLGVDYAVVETGMGGLYDATNVTGRADKVCIITDIGFDHMHILGHTLAEIAAQKIGIVHDHNQVFMYEQSEDIMKIVREWATQHQAPVQLVDVREQDRSYQQRNWFLAYQTYDYLEKRDKLQHLTSQVLEKTQKIQVPGRMDIRQVRGKTVVMDGAHNLQKMTAFINSFRQLYPDAKPTVLLAFKEGKEYEALLPLLTGLADYFIVTVFNTTQDLPVKSMDPEVLATALREAGAQKLKTVTNQKQAVEALLAAPGQICIITGSFYLLSQIRNNKGLL